MTWFVKRRRAQNPDDYETWQQEGVSPTLNAFDNTGDSRATVIIFENSFRDGARIGTSISHTLPAKMGTGGLNQPMIATAHTVRRLTPTECERLMGWPDNHTLHRADGKTNSDSTRYKMCGNGVATPVARWIAEQLLPLLK
jgi:DNA (cytosine-5)-methyltransferase 1